MEALNYSRQLAKRSLELLQIPSAEREVKQTARKMLDLHHASTKFQIPEGGVSLDDPELRGLESLGVGARLPYPYICLECAVPDERDRLTKLVTYAREQDNLLVLTCALWVKANNTWVTLPDAVTENVVGAAGYPSVEGGIFTFKVDGDDDADAEVYKVAFQILRNLLNALQCSNIHIEKHAPKKSGKLKSCLPFDAYHVLTVDVVQRRGESDAEYVARAKRSPREHMRRGHVRRYPTHKMWINHTVICAGSKGKVKKDYAITNSRLQSAQAA